MKIVIDPKKVQNEIAADQVLDAMDGTNPRAVLDFLGHFVCNDDGAPMSFDEGRKALGALPFGTIGELLKDVRRVTQDILVPPTNARD